MKISVLSFILLMKQSDKICIKIAIKSEKERDLYRKREEKYIKGTPKIILGKAEPNMQEIWIDDLRNEQITKLKEYNNTERAHLYAKTIVNACFGMANHYGYFIINENMIFFNQLR